MPRCCCCSFRWCRRPAPILPPCVHSGRNGATRQAASRTARQRARNSPASSTWSRAALSRVARLLSCFAVMPYLAFLAAFQALLRSGGITIPQRAQRPLKQALTPAICKKCDIGIVGVLDDERRQQLSGMPEACEVTIYITAHVHGSNIRRRAGSSRSCTDVYFHIIAKKCPVQVLPTPGKC